MYVRRIRGEREKGGERLIDQILSRCSERAANNCRRPNGQLPDGTASSCSCTTNSSDSIRYGISSSHGDGSC